MDFFVNKRYKIHKEMNNTITINGKEYKVKNTLRSMFIFEQITRKPFKVETMLDNYIYFFSILLASNDDNFIQWDEFIDALDTDPTILQQLTDIVTKKNKIEDLLSGDDILEGEKKN